MIEDAVGKGLMLVRQEYQLEDTLTLKRYSLDGKPEFGSAVSFAVKTRDGIVVSKNLMKPWEDDKNYSKYVGSKYRPVLTRTLVRTIDNTDWTPMDSLSFSDVSCLADDSWIETAVDDPDGFQQDTLYGEKDGWFVWFTTVGDNPETSKISLVSYKNKLSLAQRVKIMEVAPANTENTLWGAIYLTPDFSQIGKMTLLMNGIVVKNDSGWNLVLTESQITRKAPEVLTAVNDESPELTKVSNENETQDNEELSEEDLKENNDKEESSDNRWFQRKRKIKNAKK